MVNLDLIIGGILENYKLILIAIGVYILARIIIKQRKKITNEYICPNCKTYKSRKYFDKILK